MGCTHSQSKMAGYAAFYYVYRKSLNYNIRSAAEDPEIGGKHILSVILSLYRAVPRPGMVPEVCNRAAMSIYGKIRSESGYQYVLVHPAILGYIAARGIDFRLIRRLKVNIAVKMSSYLRG